MNLQQFVDWALAARSVGKYQDGSYKGECVSLINQYCWRVLNIPAGSWGNAVDWASNATVLSYFNKVSKAEPGDILVYGGTAGNPYGHIELYLGGNQSLGQNRSYSGTVVRGTTIANPIAILRSKSEDLGIMNEEDAKWLYRLGLHREPENMDVVRANTGKRFSTVAAGMQQSKEWLTQNHAIAFFGQREAQLNQAQVALSDANAKLKAALENDNLDKAAIEAAQEQATAALKQLDEVTTNFNGVKQQLDQLKEQEQKATETGNAFLRWLGEQLSKFLPGAK